MDADYNQKTDSLILNFYPIEIENSAIRMKEVLREQKKMGKTGATFEEGFFQKFAQSTEPFCVEFNFKELSFAFAFLEETLIEMGDTDEADELADFLDDVEMYCISDHTTH